MLQSIICVCVFPPSDVQQIDSTLKNLIYFDGRSTHQTDGLKDRHIERRTDRLKDRATEEAKDADR